MEFDLEKAQTGETVQLGINGIWQDFDDVYFIGYDIKGNVVYEINSYYEGLGKKFWSIEPKYLRMKPKYKTWWFRTCMYNSGQPSLIVRDSKAELLDLKLPNDMYWIEDPYSKLIMDKDNEYTC